MDNNEDSVQEAALPEKAPSHEVKERARPRPASSSSMHPRRHHTPPPLVSQASAQIPVEQQAQQAQAPVQTQGSIQIQEPQVPLKTTKIADIQRMNIDELATFGKNMGLQHIGSLTKSQMVFEIVKCISENPNEMLYGEGVLEVLPDGFGFLR